MAYRNGYYLYVNEPHGIVVASFFPQMRWHVCRARRTARAEDCRVLPDEAGQFLNVIAVLVADQNRVDVRYGESDGGKRTL